MQFYNLWGLLALGGIPVILLFYFLKRKQQERIVPSLFLWKRAEAFSLAEEPWQKLKKSKLLFLQLLAVVVLAIVLANPYRIGMESGQNQILVLDQSLSMQAVSNGKSRFDEAKEKMADRIKNSPPGTVFSLLVLGREPYIVSSGISEKQSLYTKLAAIPVTNSGVSIENGAALMKMQQEQTGGTLYLFSDREYGFQDMELETIPIGKTEENLGLTHLSYAKQDNGAAVFVRAENFSDRQRETSVSLYADNEIFDTKEVFLEPWDSADIVFSDVSSDAREFIARLAEEDALSEDNRITGIAGQAEEKRVLLATEQNLFLEKLFSLLPDIEVLKTQKLEGEILSGYDLYLFDGILPDTLPEDGHLLIFYPPEQNTFFPAEKAEITEKVKVALDSPIFSAVPDLDFAVQEAMRLSIPSWGTVWIQAGDVPLLVAGERNGQKILVFGFDLHQTDLPLRKEFPMLMYYCMQYLFPGSTGNGEAVLAGSPVEFSIPADVTEATVYSPTGRPYLLAPPFPVLPFTQTDMTGIYTLQMKRQTGEIQTERFVVNADRQEADLTVTAKENSEEGSGKKTEGSVSLTPLFGILFLALLVVEWWVNCHEHVY